MTTTVVPNESYFPEILLSVALHLVVLGLLVFNFSFQRETERVVVANIIDAVVIDSGVMEAAKREEEQKKALAEQRRREQDQQKQQTLQQQQEKEHQAKLAEQKRIADEKQKVEQQRLKVEEQKRQETARKAEEERRRQELRAEEQRVQEQQQRAEWDRLQAQEAAAAQQARSRELASKKALYVEAIRQKVERNWIRPASSQTGDRCNVFVQQIPGGDIVDVRVDSCSGDALFQRSVEAAVRKASPLPDPPEPALFERQINFTFIWKE
jgi:colicin import membrane protein